MLPQPLETQVLFEPFKKQEEFLEAALSGKYRFVLYGGAIRGGKTYVLLALFIFLCRVFPGSRWAIVRKDLPTIKRNTYPTWEKVKPTNFIISEPQSTHTCTMRNGSQIIFFPETIKTDKELNRWKGFEVNGIGFEEINECQAVTLQKAFERTGSYVIPNLAVQPFPIVVATCNPTQGWVKEKVFTPWENGTLKKSWLYIQAKITDNLPLLAQQPDYLPGLKENLSVYEYRVFVEGDWNVNLKTGGEFLRDFDLDQHVKPVKYEDGPMIQLSMDSNVYPYIAMAIWQFIEQPGGCWIIRQVDELPCEDPDNTATRAGDEVVDYLTTCEYEGRLGMYGDKSTKNRNNIDPNHRSFYQIVEQKIKDGKYSPWDRIWKAPPTVRSMGEFVNAIFRGEVPKLKIEIGEHCKKSIGDYIDTKTNNDGGILKVEVAHPKIEGVKYQKNGHFTDTLKDIICQAFNDEYKQFTQRHKRLVPGGITVINRGGNVTF